MTNKKIIIVVGILLVIFSALVFWPVKKQGDETQVKKAPVLAEPTSEFFMNSAKKIEWRIDTEKEYKTAEGFLIDYKKWNDEDKVKIRELLTGGALPIGQFFSIYDNLDRYEFSRNVQEENELEKGEMNDDEIKTQFYELMTKFYEVNSKLEVKIDRTEYKQFLYPWWVSGTKEEHDVVEIEASYMFNNLPMRLFNGYPIIADYFTNGKLTKIQGQLPFEGTNKTAVKDLLSLEELKSKKIDNFKIWRVDGGQEYELSGEDVAVDKIDIYDYNLGYIYDFKSRVVWPFYFLDGNAQLSTGPAKIILIISATK